MEFSEDEAQALIDSFKSLGVKPKGDTPQELQQWMLDYLGLAGKLPKVENPDTPKTPLGHIIKNNVSITTRTPNLTVFSGDPKAKNESFDLWKYEITCLLEESQHSKTTIAEAARRSLRGEAAKVVKRLGPGAPIEVILTKLTST